MKPKEQAKYVKLLKKLITDTDTLKANATWVVVAPAWWTDMMELRNRAQKQLKYYMKGGR